MQVVAAIIETRRERAIHSLAEAANFRGGEIDSHRFTHGESGGGNFFHGDEQSNQISPGFEVRRQVEAEAAEHADMLTQELAITERLAFHGYSVEFQEEAP